VRSQSLGSQRRRLDSATPARDHRRRHKSTRRRKARPRRKWLRPRRRSPRRQWPGPLAANASPSEAVSLLRLVEQQLREAELRLHSLFLALKAFDNLLKADSVGPEHRPAAIDGPAVAVDPYNIDIRRALSDAFL